MSPSVGRKNGPKKDDENQLILNSPTSDGDGNSILNGNTEVGFVFPNVKLKKTPVSQVSFFKKYFPFIVKLLRGKILAGTSIKISGQ